MALDQMHAFKLDGLRDKTGIQIVQQAKTSGKY
jgi:hypothetical protein